MKASFFLGCFASLAIGWSVFGTSYCYAQELLRNSEGKTVGFKYTGKSEEIQETIRAIRRTDEIFEVFLGGHNVTSVEVECLKEFKELNSLSIGDFPDEIASISNEVMKGIVSLQGIKHLELNLVDSRDVDWSVLKDAKFLQSLTIRGEVAFRDSAIEAIAELEHLESLWLDGDFGEANSLRPLKRCRNLESLDLGGKSMERFLTDLLNSELRLTHLELSSVFVSHSQLLRIDEMCGRSLQLLSVGFSDTQCFKLIRNFESLEHLAVVMPKPCSIEIALLPLPPKLKTFVLRND